MSNVGNPIYCSASRIRQQYDVCSASLRNWALKGDIRYIQIDADNPRSKRLYHFEDVEKRFGITRSSELQGIIYARVSSSKQKDDLGRQIKDLQSAYPHHKLISDIGSGLNWKRKGLLTLLDRVTDGHVLQVVVAHRDRLARFGVDLLEWVFQKYHVEFVVLHDTQESIDEPNTGKELKDDLLAVITYFTAQNNGRRSAQNKRDRKKQSQDKEDQGLS